MKYIKFFENRDILSSLGIKDAKKIGSGQEGTVYSYNNKAVKVIEHDFIDSLPEKLDNLKKAKGKDFKHLVDIFDYKIKDGNLIIIMELLDENYIIEYQGYSDGDIDYCSIFFEYYHRDRKTAVENAIKDLKGEFEDGYSYNFTLGDYDESMEHDFRQYFSDLLLSFDELYANNFDIDPIDENVGFCNAEKRFKVIDYV